MCSGGILLSGAFGGLGEVYANNFVERARAVFLFGRKGVAVSQKSLVANGVGPVVFGKCDVTASDDVSSFVMQSTGSSGTGITGILHLAGVLQDGFLTNLSWDKFVDVINPKVKGARSMWRCKRSEETTVFMFSSITSMLGNVGQSNYALANGFLDGFAESSGAISVNWGAWNVGMYAAVDSSMKVGGGGFSADVSLPLLNLATVGGGHVSFGIFGMDWSKNKSFLARHLVPAQVERKGMVGSISSVKDIEDSVVRITGEVLGSLDVLDEDAALQELGFDSVLSLELRQSLSDAFGVDLPATLLYDYPTVSQLKKKVVETVMGENEDVFEAAPAAATATATASTAVAVSPSLGDDAPGSSVIVSGYGARFSSSDTPEKLWALLLDGKDQVSQIPLGRLPEGISEEELEIASSKWGSFLSNVKEFDSFFFNISPREAIALDPQHRMLLECTWSVIESSGRDPLTLKDSKNKTGVYVGISGCEYAKIGPEDDMNHTGTSMSTACGRISYIFGATGASISVDTACSSSLISFIYGCKSVERGEEGMALCFGVQALCDVRMFRTLERAGMLSPEGRCKTFDVEANGYVRGEGCGGFLVKKEERGDLVIGRVCGHAVNQDGRSNGLTAPNGPSQVRLIKEALKVARMPGSKVGMLEAHGTGTNLGDPIEVQAINEAHGNVADRAAFVIGSVKTIFGHTEAASGALSLLKGLLSMENQFVPRHLNMKNLNEFIGTSLLEKMRATIPLEEISWKQEEKVVGTSSFGYSGTNAHVILAKRGHTNPLDDVAVTKGSLCSVRVGAKTTRSLQLLCESYVDMLEEAGDVLTLSQGSLNGRSRALPLEVVVSASTAKDMAKLLVSEAFAASRGASGVKGSSMITESRLGSKGKMRVPTYRFDREVFWFGEKSEAIEMFDWKAISESPVLASNFLLGYGGFAGLQEVTFYDAGLSSFHLMGLSKTVGNIVGFKITSSTFFDCPSPIIFCEKVVGEEHRPKLIAFASEVAKIPTIDSLALVPAGVEEMDSYPLTTFQLVLEFMNFHVVEVDTAAAFTFELPRSMNFQKVSEVISVWQSRHESLRTRLNEDFWPESIGSLDKYRLIVDDTLPVPIEHLGVVDSIAEMELAARLFIPRDYVLPGERLWRVGYIGVGERSFLVTQLSHLVFDGFSLIDIIEDLGWLMNDLNSPPQKQMTMREFMNLPRNIKAESYRAEPLQEYWPLVDVASILFQRWERVSGHHVALFAAIAHMAIGGIDDWTLFVVKGERSERTIDGCAVGLVPIKISRGDDENEDRNCEDEIDHFFTGIEENGKLSEREFWEGNYRRSTLINFFPPAAKVDEDNEFKVHSVPTPKGSQNIGRRIVDRVRLTEADVIFHQSSSWVFLAPVQAVLISSLSHCTVAHCLRDVARRAAKLWHSKALFKDLIKLPKAAELQLEDWSVRDHGVEKYEDVSDNWNALVRQTRFSKRVYEFPFQWDSFCSLVSRLKCTLRRHDLQHCSIQGVKDMRLACVAVISVATSGGCVSNSQNLTPGLMLCEPEHLANFSKLGMATLGINEESLGMVEEEQQQRLVARSPSQPQSARTISVFSGESKKVWTSVDLVRAWGVHDGKCGKGVMGTSLGDEEFCAKVLAITSLYEIQFVQANPEELHRLNAPIGVQNSHTVFYGFGQAVYSGQSAGAGPEMYDSELNDGRSMVHHTNERVLRRDNGAISFFVARTATDCVLRDYPAREKVMPEFELEEESKIGESIRDVLAVMFEMFPGDEVLAQVAKGLDFALMFTLPDVGISFHLKFENDSISAYFVEPNAEANVKFQMTADVLDGIFLQRLNVMGAAFAGQIVFQGDVEKAILLQGFLGDFARLYRIACEKCQVAPRAVGELPKSSAVMRLVEQYAPVALGWGFAHKRQIGVIFLLLFVLLIWKLFFQQ
jgi:3-oxoacyl-(acyl-carrier-protein) synthase/acyl carrier protein